MGWVAVAIAIAIWTLGEGAGSITAGNGRAEWAGTTHSARVGVASTDFSISLSASAGRRF